MYVTFIDYFTVDQLSNVRQIIDDHLTHDVGLEEDLFSFDKLDFDVISSEAADDDNGSTNVTVWLRQTGRRKMSDAIDDLTACLDAGDCIDWSKIPRETHRHGEL